MVALEQRDADAARAAVTAYMQRARDNVVRNNLAREELLRDELAAP